MKAIKILLGVIVGFMVLLFGVGLMLPDTAHVERSIVIKAPASDVYRMVNSFQRFNEWSPWHARDPQAQYTYSGPQQGVGAGMAWRSDHPQVGNGSQVIIGNQENRRVEVELDFGPDGKAIAYYDLLPATEGTQITWGFDTEFEGNIMGRYFGLMMDGMLGPDYEAGLVNLKAVMEQ